MSGGSRATSVLAVAIVLLSAGPAAVAAPCYVVFDRNDAIIFRDYKPPFDLSDANSREREMMRRQGQHMLVAEFGEDCNPVGFISASTGATAASVEGDRQHGAPGRCELRRHIRGDASPPRAPAATRRPRRLRRSSG
jgi:hypothetical protein